MITAFALALLLAFFLTGLPVFVAFLAFNLLAALYLMGPGGLILFPASMLDTLTVSEMVTVPLFILLGELLFRSGSIDVLFTSLDKLVGRLRGHDNVIIVLSSVLLGALSGSAIAVAALLGRTLLPSALDRGAEPKLAAGLALGSACLAPIIPPSILIVIIGMLSNTSIAKLLLAGILPGLLAAVLFLAYVQIVTRRKSAAVPAPARHISTREKALALLRLLPFSIVIFLVLGLILLGIATPTESAACGVFGALIVAAIYRRLSLRLIWESLQGAVHLSAMILVIMASSKIFTQLLAFSGVTRDLVTMASQVQLSGFMMFCLLMVIPFILCMFFDQIALLLILVPIYMPIVTSQGFDPIVFWTALTLNLTIGSITPPFGYALFSLRASLGDRMSLSDIYLSVWPFVITLAALVLVIYAVPALTNFLPNLM